MMKSDGGSIAIRGFVVQTLIALLRNLKLNGQQDLDWTHVTLEPKLSTEKVDILWNLAGGGARAVQVKSTKGAFEPGQLNKWGEELLRWKDEPGVTYELVLVEQEPNAKIDKIKQIGLEDDPARVCKIVREKLDIDAFRQRAAHLLGILIEQKLPRKLISQESCLTLVCRLESELNDRAIRQQSLDRDGLINLIGKWCQSVTARELPVIRLFLSAADDVVEAATAAMDRAIEAFNRLDSERDGIRIERIDWAQIPGKQPWGPKSGEFETTQPPQHFVAVLSRRLGAKGGRRGTAHKVELDQAIKSWKDEPENTIAFFFDEDASDGLRKAQEILNRADVAYLEEELVDRQHHVKVLRYRSRYDESLGNQIKEHLRAVVNMYRPSPVVVGIENERGSAVNPPVRPAAVVHYLQRLIDETAFLRLIGLGRSERHRLSIETAFVPLQVLFDSRDDERPRGRLKDVDSPQSNRVELDQVFRYARKAGRRAVVLLGEPGAGKTTAARQLAWSLASGNKSADSYGLPEGLVPVLLRLREFPADLDDSDTVLNEFLCRATKCAEVAEKLRSPGPDLLESAHLLWIFDGLDEVFETELRRRLARSLRAIVEARPQDHFLVTSRYHGYYDKGVPLGEQFLTFHVELLSDDDMRKFVGQWFTAMANSEVTKDRATLQGEKQAKAKALGDKLSLPQFETQRLRELARNPLMLTLLCLIYDERQDLPENRADLYAECIKVLLEHWRRLLVSDQKFDPETATDVLARVAWHLQSVRRQLEAPIAELQKTAAKLLQRGNGQHGLGTDGKEFLELMLGPVGILAMSGGPSAQCGFLHRTFQESLAARYATKHGQARKMAEAAASAQDDWWHETVLVSLREEKFCRKFFREMLAAGIAEKQSNLADLCLKEAKYFYPEPFVDVLRDPTSPPERVAAVLRMMRNKTDRIPGLAETVRPLATGRSTPSTDASTQTSIRGIAQEILLMTGHQLPANDTGKVYVDSRTNLTFMAIPAGRFEMGGNREEDERPIHEVRITRDFWLAKYPVTNGQYELFLKAQGGQVPPPKYWDDRRFNQPNQPVVGVSWHEAQQYCLWAGGRLPTEAEWEYSCRAGTTTEYWFGDDSAQLDTYAWFGKNSEGRTWPVGDRPGNPWGLFDMHGNVWEWCQDWYSSEYYAQCPKDDPQGPSKASNRVVRGGSWYDYAAGCRSAYRAGFVPDDRDNDLGFRVALSSIRDKYK